MSKKEFANRDMTRFGEEKVSTYIPGWQKAVQKYGARASIEDLKEVIASLRRLRRKYVFEGECCSYPLHEAAKNGAVKLMDIILNTSYDLNAKKDYCGWTALHEACHCGRSETVKLMINSSKDLGIDLNARDDIGRTPFHFACKSAFIERMETVELMIKSSKDFSIDLNAKDIVKTPLHSACEDANLVVVELMVKNWKEFCIDIKAQNSGGYTPLDITNFRLKNPWNKRLKLKRLKQIKKMLENEYSKMDDAEQSD